MNPRAIHNRRRIFPRWQSLFFMGFANFLLLSHHIFLGLHGYWVRYTAVDSSQA